MQVVHRSSADLCLIVAFHRGHVDGLRVLVYQVPCLYISPLVHRAQDDENPWRALVMEGRWSLEVNDDPLSSFEIVQACWEEYAEDVQEQSLKMRSG